MVRSIRCKVTASIGVRDILVDGLPVLDLLEVTASTGSVAALTRCDQSSISRLYRHASHQLGLDFRKTNGHYRAHANLPILRPLRQASQLLRLTQGSTQLRWLGNPWNSATLQSVGGMGPLPRPWRGEQRTLELLQERVLDLAVINGLDALPPGWEDSRLPFHFGPWVAVGVVRYPIAPPCQSHHHPLHRPGQADDVALAASAGRDLDAVVLLHEHLEHPAVQQLIGRIREAYHGAYRHRANLAWL